MRIGDDTKGIKKYNYDKLLGDMLEYETYIDKVDRAWDRDPWISYALWSVALFWN